MLTLEKRMEAYLVFPRMPVVAGIRRADSQEIRGMGGRERDCPMGHCLTAQTLRKLAAIRTIQRLQS
jgi:hypothetical protein